MVRKFTFILLLLSKVTFSQELISLGDKFNNNPNFQYPKNFITLPIAIDLSKSKIDVFEKEKIQGQIDYFLTVNPEGLKQAVYRKKMYLKKDKSSILGLMGLALSGFQKNYFNLSFPIAAKYGLTMNERIDERNDFVKSYRVSDQWVKHISGIFHTPEEVLLAFINTPSGLKRAKNRAKSDKLSDYYIYLPEETRDAYFTYLAISEILQKSEISDMNIRLQENLKLIEVEKEFDLNLFEKVTGRNKTIITTLNPTLITYIVPKSFLLTYSNDSLPSFLDSVYYYQDSILNNPEIIKEKEQDSIKVVLKDVYYKVKKGDNLHMISNWYDVEIQELKIWNKLPTDAIEVGQVLKLWVDENLAFDLSKISFLSQEIKEQLLEETSYIEVLKEFKYYTVVKGDALWKISQRYDDVTAEDIMRWNGISENIEIGQRILIKIEK